LHFCHYSYIYLRETGLYYLQSRYYNPTWGRFLNADSLLATGQGLLGCNLFAYCFNNPVDYHDPSGHFAITTTILIAAIIGGAIAGATINTISYLSTNEEPTTGGIIGALTIGAVTGGLGGAAGMLGGGWAIGLSMAAGLVSGTYTAITTEGPFEQKMLAGLTSAVFAGGGAYLGSLIPLDGLSFGLTLAGNAIFGMTIGGYLEYGNSTIQGLIGKDFETHASNNTQHSLPSDAVLPRTQPVINNLLPSSIPIFA
jgi:RHS repeat-associated protein